jgi:23S rRNA (cytidine1920-2'-O)/16S rRNA (cytidine1409-2'-O)-methyltransferase
LILRLDEALVTLGHYATRSRARDAIERGCIVVNGSAARKPSQKCFENDVVTIADAAQTYVSRAALKLIHALDHFALTPNGQHCLDIGASTGGFTQVLLQRGAAHVVALDVGHGQLDPTLRNDPKVTTIEGLNARDLAREHVVQAPAFIVSDVSFISLKLVLPPALAMASESATLIALIKPQFEVGRALLPRDGVVKNIELHARVQADIVNFVEDSGWRVLGVTPSPLEGGDGNREFLIAAKKI